VTGAGRLIQALILFSTAFGAFFLWEVYPILPSFVFDFLAFGWFLFLVDSILTFVRPGFSYYLGLILALLALTATFSQPEHYSLVQSGNLEATVTLLVGSASQVAIVVVVLYRILNGRKRVSPWPGAKSQV
jgi:hypothetical protein